MKYVSKFRLVPGCREEYKRRHDEIWPEMLELMGTAGIRNYSIWNRGDELVEYFETDDMETLCAALADSPVKKRWDVYMSDIIRYDTDENGLMTPLTCLFEFTGKEQ
jgi:L-rhamnose mutarotase